ncbi:MAG: cellulase family glycosylhydrolase [Oscillospiraceae bacterium]|nr:cellulase family glycosylhydrolase [Oscillospiraceae bacterium]
MKAFRRITAAAAAFAMTIAAGSGISLKNTEVTEISSVKAADDCHDDWVHAEGNRLYDMNGKEVWLTGCNWFGYNVGSQVFDGVWSANMHQCLNEIADHGFNLLRVPMSTEIILGWKEKKPDEIIKVNPYSNPELTVSGEAKEGEIMYSFDIWNLAVKWCKENGIKIMMDIHSAETASAGHQIPVWYTDKFTEDDWIEALEWFTDYYKDDDTIIAIDLKNEPHGKKDEGQFAKWDDSSDLNNWKRAAERGAKACLDINPNILIMVEGIEVYPKFDKGMDWNSPSVDYAHYGDPDAQPYYGTWWGGNFRGVKDHPLDLGKYQKQLVYSPHDYGPLVYAQTWFDKDFNSETLMKDCWHDNWFYLIEDNTAPLLMGEWGGFIDKKNDPTGDNTKWMTCLRDLMIENHINHTFWCFNENSGDTGGLVYDNFGKWDEEKYALVEPALWQDESGKFISLDHQRPLGQGGNGISVAEYYGGTISRPETPVTTPKVTEAPKPVTTTAKAEESKPVTTTVKAEESKPVTTTVKTEESKPVTTTVKTEESKPVTTTAVTTAEKPSNNTSASEVVYGDVNQDGRVDITDISVTSLRILDKKPFTAAESVRGDVDGDGEVGLTDLASMKQFVSKVITHLGPEK